MTKIKRSQIKAFMFILMTCMFIIIMGIKVHAAPSGSYKTQIIVNGRSVLSGDTFVYEGETYVPMFRFCAWLGKFTYSYDYWSKTAHVKGEALSISASVGDLYVEANGRYFYTSNEILLTDGEVYVPIRAITRALNSHIKYDSVSGMYEVSSGDSRLLVSGDRFYRDDEVLWLARIIHAESQGEPMKGKIAVGNVILNRVRSSEFPNTIYGVIFDKKYGVQFTPVANGTIYNTPNSESIIAAKICLEGYSLSNEILYFLNPRLSSSSWVANNRRFAFAVKNHSFYY